MMINMVTIITITNISIHFHMVIFGRTRQILGIEAAVFMGMEDDGEYVTNRMIFGCV
jgi:hypothetical protein